MTDTPTRAQALQEVLKDRLAAREDHGRTVRDDQVPALRDLHARLETSATPRPEPLRSLHHFACTGGTLIAKALASMPNTVMLSEIDPLSLLHLRAPKPPFFPTDLITGLRYCPREIGEDTILAVFEAGLLALRDRLTRQGLHLVLRDHAHSQFCTLQDRHARPGFHAILAGIGPVQGLVTVRHPLDSFLSLQRNDWIHFSPGTFEEYCLRYLDFLDVHDSLPVYKYETFVAEPAKTTARMCKDLALPYDPDFEIAMPLARLSGDSGRSGISIGPRPRAPVPTDLGRDAAQSSSYAVLCKRLGYDAQL